MRTSEAVKKQLTARLGRLRRRAADLAAEIAMVEQMMADFESRSINPRLKLRKNGVNKLALQGAIRRLLKERGAPVRAKDVLIALQQVEPSLKSSTFRSHLRRMVEAGIIMPEGSRGFYKIVDENKENLKEAIYLRRKEQWIPRSYERNI